MGKETDEASTGRFIGFREGSAPVPASLILLWMP
jgi:hypothetical protein